MLLSSLITLAVTFITGHLVKKYYNVNIYNDVENLIFYIVALFISTEHINILSKYNLSEILTNDFLIHKNIPSVIPLYFVLIIYFIVDLILFYKKKSLLVLLHHLFTSWYLFSSYHYDIFHGTSLISLSQEISSIFLGLIGFIKYKNNIINLLFFINFIIFKIIVPLSQLIVSFQHTYTQNSLQILNLFCPCFLLYSIFFYWFIIILKNFMKNIDKKK